MKGVLANAAFGVVVVASTPVWLPLILFALIGRAASDFLVDVSRA